MKKCLGTYLFANHKIIKYIPHNSFLQARFIFLFPNISYYRIICSDEYGKGLHMQNGGKMEQRFSNLRDTLDSVSESVIDKLIPAVIKMQKDVKVTTFNISTIHYHM